MKTSFTSGFKRSFSTFCLSCLSCLSLYPVSILSSSSSCHSFSGWHRELPPVQSLVRHKKNFLLSNVSHVWGTLNCRLLFCLSRWIISESWRRQRVVFTVLFVGLSLCVADLCPDYSMREWLFHFSRNTLTVVSFSVSFSLSLRMRCVCMSVSFVSSLSLFSLCLVFLSRYVWCLFTFLIFAPHFSLLSSSFRRKRESLIDVLKIEREWIIHSIVFLSSCHWHLYQNVFRFLTHGSLILEKREDTWEAVTEAVIPRVSWFDQSEVQADNDSLLYSLISICFLLSFFVIFFHDKMWKKWRQSVGCVSSRSTFSQLYSLTPVVIHVTSFLCIVL